MSELRRAYRFAIAGAIGFLIDAGVLFLVIGILGPVTGRVVSFVAAVLVTWLINRRLAFADRASKTSLTTEFASYLSAMVAGGAVNLAVYAVVLAQFGAAGLVPWIGVALGSLAGMAMNLTLARLVVFRHPRDGG